MVKVASVGVVTAGCDVCEKLKERMARNFAAQGVQLDFVEVFYEIDTDYAMSICEEMGFDDIPSFEVAGVVFQDGFADKQVTKALGRLR